MDNLPSASLMEASITMPPADAGPTGETSDVRSTGDGDAAAIPCCATDAHRTLRQAANTRKVRAQDARREPRTLTRMTPPPSGAPPGASLTQTRQLTRSPVHCVNPERCETHDTDRRWRQHVCLRPCLAEFAGVPRGCSCTGRLRPCSDQIWMFFSTLVLPPSSSRTMILTL